MTAFGIQPFDVEACKEVLEHRRKLAVSFLKIPGATVTLTDWRTLDDLDKAALVQAGAEVEAEKLYKLSQIFSKDPIAIADAISEADGGILRDRLRLNEAVSKAAQRLGGG